MSNHSSSDMYLKGCLCLDDIPEECIREFTNDKGETKRYLNFHIYKDLMPKHKTNRRGKDIVYTHNMVAMPAKFGSGKVQIAMLEERTSPFDGKEPKKTKEKKEPNQQTKNESHVSVFDYSAVDEDLF